MVVLPAFAMGLSAAFACRPLAGADMLWRRRELQWIIVGEEHGTTEIPAVFADLVCAAKKTNRPIIVALEQAPYTQKDIDAYMASSGDLAARQRFLRSEMWNSPIKDGRTSEAYFLLVERLRQLHMMGAVQRVVAFAATTSDVQAREKEMASNLASIPATRDELVLVFTGNIHAATSDVKWGDITFKPAAGWLPPKQTLTLNVRTNGGASWNCSPDCGPHPENVNRHKPRGVVILKDRRSGYDGYLELGTRTSASSPATEADGGSN